MFVAVPIEIRQVRASNILPTANSVLVAINVIVFGLGVTSNWHIGPGQAWWSVLSYGFTHASAWHLIGNMYVLLLIGNPVNRRLGNAYYALAYCGTIVAMGLLGWLSGLGPLMGSSGAIFAVVAMFILLMPAAIVKLSYLALFPVSLLVGLINKPDEWLEWFFRYGTFHVRAWWTVMIVPLIELWGLFWWRIALGAWESNHLSHLIG